MKPVAFLLNLALLSYLSLSAQVRYLDPVFPEIQVEQGVEYGQNAMLLLGFDNIVKVPLLMDVYQPYGDSIDNRPVAILIHGGNFLPPSWSANYLGTRNDSALVYLATQLARRGYVVAVMDYRLGWNPLTSSASERKYTLVNALYRGIQDVNTCARFFSKNANEYHIDPNKILLWGDESGGLLAFSTASLDSFEEWQLSQFIDPIYGPMVEEAVNGDIWATSTGVAPADHPFYEEGSILCYPNHVGYEVSYKLAISMNGAVVDTSWMDAGEAAFVAFHALPDPTVPYDYCGYACLLCNLPGYGPMLESCGDLQAVHKALELGNNDAFAGMSFPGDFSEIANTRNEGVDGLFPLHSIVISSVEIDYPWQWWDESLSPNSTTAADARLYLDTMLAYVAPRACLALDLNCTSLTATSAPAPPPSGIQVAPNPARNELTVHWENGSAATGLLEIRTLEGRLLHRQATSGPQALLHVGDLPPGLYLLRWQAGRTVTQTKFVRN